MMENAVAAFNVVVRLVGLHMLILKIELHVSTRKRFGGLLVVFHVIRPQSRIPVANVHVIVGNIQIPPTALRTTRRKISYATGFKWQMRLLRRRSCRGYGKNINKEKSRNEPAVRGGGFPRGDTAVYNKHVSHESSWIA